MSFSGDVDRFVVGAHGLSDRALKIAAAEFANSLTVGSAVTGSQGTPVDTGFARDSWSCLGSIGPGGLEAAVGAMRPGDTREIVGGAIYLRGLEEGRARTRPAGWARLSTQMWPRIVAWAAQRAQGGGTANSAVPGGGSLRRRGPSTPRKPSNRSRGRRKW